MILSENANIKNYACKLEFYNEKKNEKDFDDFDVENWLWMSNFGTFWQHAINPKFQIQ